MSVVVVIHCAFEDTPQTVAYVNVGGLKSDPSDGESYINEALDYAYRWTQNIQDSWSFKMEEDGNDDVEVVGEFYVDKDGKKWGHRSTSMGDQLLFGDKKYYVDTFGFSEKMPDIVKAMHGSKRKRAVA